MKTRTALLALALAPLAGCGETPTDPYVNVQMQAPVQAGGAVREEDPALREERDYNAQFSGSKR